MRSILSILFMRCMQSKPLLYYISLITLHFRQTVQTDGTAGLSATDCHHWYHWYHWFHCEFWQRKGNEKQSRAFISLNAFRALCLVEFEFLVKPFVSINVIRAKTPLADANDYCLRTVESTVCGLQCTAYASKTRQ